MAVSSAELSNFLFLSLSLFLFSAVFFVSEKKTRKMRRKRMMMMRRGRKRRRSSGRVRREGVEQLDAAVGVVCGSAVAQHSEFSERALRVLARLKRLLQLLDGNLPASRRVRRHALRTKGDFYTREKQF